MLVFLKPTSRTVHHYHEEEHEEHKNYNTNQEACISLTVWRKSLLLSCKGFTVIGSDGSLVYRVDNYSVRPDQIILMDGAGNPIFTVCRRKVYIHIYTHIHTYKNRPCLVRFYPNMVYILSVTSFLILVHSFLTFFFYLVWL